MLHRILATVCACAVPALAQYEGEPPIVLSSAELPASLFGLASVRDIEVEPGPGATLMVFLSGRRPGQSDYDLIGGRWNLQNGQFTEVPGLGLDQLNTSADESSVTVSSDLLYLIYDTPNGPMLAARPTTSAPFGIIQMLSNVGAQPVNACLVTDDRDPTHSWILADGTRLGIAEVRVMAIDLTAPGTSAGNPVTVVAKNASTAMTSGPILMRIPPNQGHGGGYGNIYVMQTNGEYRCIPYCYPTDPTALPTALGPAMTYYSNGGGIYANVTGTCQCYGTQFFADGSATVKVLHLTDLTSVRVPQGGAQFEYAMYGPVRGVPGAGQQNAPGQMFLLLGTLLPGPVAMPPFLGNLAVQPKVMAGPFTSSGGYAAVNLSLPNGLPAGGQVDVQLLYLDASSPYLALGVTANLASQ